MPEPKELLAGRLRRQAGWCADLGSPLYASLLRSAADDLLAGGPVWDVLEGFEDEAGTAAVALRFMGAVHRLVLDDTLPELARHYPSTGGEGDASATWPVFRQGLVDERAKLRTLLGAGCQTNEVGRSAALMGGFLEVAHRTHLPLRILEIGASAGLNLRWDRYRYESTEGAWGDASSAVRFVHSFEIPPPMNRSAEVVERKGCDLQPLDPTSQQDALTLRSFIWADQLGRLALLDGAIEIAGDMPVEIERTPLSSSVSLRGASTGSRRRSITRSSCSTSRIPLAGGSAPRSLPPSGSQRLEHPCSTYRWNRARRRKRGLRSGSTRT